MTPEEIRAKALECTVRFTDNGWSGTFDDMLSMAIKAADFIAGLGPVIEVSANLDLSPAKDAFSPYPTITSDPEPHDVGHAEDIWGAPCARPGCGHSQGLHGPTGCHYPPDSTHPNFCECDAFAAPGSCTCAHPLTGPEHFGGLGCTSVFDGVRCECRYDGGNR